MTEPDASTTPEVPVDPTSAPTEGTAVMEDTVSDVPAVDLSQDIPVPSDLTGEPITDSSTVSEPDNSSADSGTVEPVEVPTDQPESVSDPATPAPDAAPTSEPAGALVDAPSGEASSEPVPTPSSEESPSPADGTELPADPAPFSPEGSVSGHEHETVTFTETITETITETVDE